MENIIINEQYKNDNNNLNVDLISFIKYGSNLFKNILNNSYNNNYTKHTNHAQYTDDHYDAIH